jgi:single-stranded DNA-binding protein
VNHCLIEVEVLEAPQVRYTQDNQTPVAEMGVQFDGLRPDDPPSQLKVVGWGNLAQELQSRVQVGQRLMLEGRLRMNTVTRQDGVKEKRAEFTLARLHPLGSGGGPAMAPAPAVPQAQTSAAPVRRVPGPSSAAPSPGSAAAPAPQPASQPPTWNTAPLVPDLPDDDDIPF